MCGRISPVGQELVVFVYSRRVAVEHLRRRCRLNGQRTLWSRTPLYMNNEKFFYVLRTWKLFRYGGHVTVWGTTSNDKRTFSYSVYAEREREIEKRIRRSCCLFMDIRLQQPTAFLTRVDSHSWGIESISRYR